MRIDILPNTAASIPEMGNPKPEGDPGRENNSFFAVIDQMTSFAGPWKRDGEAEPARDVDKADDHGCDHAVAPILPFGSVNTEIQTSLRDAPEPMAALPQTDSAPARQVGNDAAGVLASAIVTDVDAAAIAGSSAPPPPRHRQIRTFASRGLLCRLKPLCRPMRIRIPNFHFIPYAREPSIRKHSMCLPTQIRLLR